MYKFQELESSKYYDDRAEVQRRRAQKRRQNISLLGQLVALFLLTVWAGFLSLQYAEVDVVQFVAPCLESGLTSIRGLFQR